VVVPERETGLRSAEEPHKGEDPGSVKKLCGGLVVLMTVWLFLSLPKGRVDLWLCCTVSMGRVALQKASVPRSLMMRSSQHYEHKNSATGRRDMGD